MARTTQYASRNLVISQRLLTPSQDQWQRKKQSKEEKRKAKMAKLDPANNISALDVHKENERKRKRELGEEDEQPSDLEGASKEMPKEGLKPTKQNSKKQKTDPAQPNGTTDTEARQKQIADKRREARERKKAKKAKDQEKKEAKKARKAQISHTEKGEDKPTGDAEDITIDQEDVEDDAADEQMDDVDFSGLAAETEAPAESSDESIPSSPTFDKDNTHSSSSSTSSIVPPADTHNALETSAAKAHKPAKPRLDTSAATTESAPATTTDTAARDREGTKSPKLPTIDSSVLQARLAARLEALRAARKADGLNGKPAKNRQELIEARRRKEEARRAHKKELRAKARVEKDVEAEAARLRGGSGSPLWSASPVVGSPAHEANNFEFGRVAFDDGAQLDSSLRGLLDARKKKGPQDTKTALEAAQRKQARISGLDTDKRAEIEEKDRWLNAKKRVHGEKLRDDASLLKKTLKREEKQKGKSEKAWGERIEGVRHGKEMKQKRREENLLKRREGKGVKGGSKGKAKAKGGKPKKRPGFEGSFKAGGGASKK